MVFMPPRHGKSELISRLFSAYFLYRYPEKWVAVSSYGADLAYSLSRSSRENYLASGAPMASDAAAVKQWETGKGGGLWATGVGGPATGKGWHLGIIDDPLKNAEEAASLKYRDKQVEWLSSTWMTREEPWSDTDPHGAEIHVQTRWHEDDLAGYRLKLERESQDDGDTEPERWHIVCMEAIKEVDPHEWPETCTLEPDWRETGEALCPERRPIEKLRRLSARIGSYHWGALFQQRPSAKEGNLFKVGKISVVDEVPPDLPTVRAWDHAATEGDGNWTVGVRMTGPDKDGIFYVEDVTRGQWSTDNRNARMKRTAESDGVGVKIRGVQDPGAAGVDASKAFIKMMAGYAVRTVRPTGSKEVRADPFSSQVNAGNVRMVKAHWNKAFLEELRTFPKGDADDQVDAASDAFTELTGSTRLEWEFD